MAAIAPEISSNFCFDPRRKLTAKISSNALKLFSKGHSEAVALKGNLPIFLDANILLGYYGMAQKEKIKLLKILRELSPRIVITRQIEQEYLRNRPSVIKKEFFAPLAQVSSEFDALNQQIKKILQSYIDENKRIFELDYPSLWEKLNEIKENVGKAIDADGFYDKMKTEIEDTSKTNKNLIYQDDLLDVVAGLNFGPELSETETKYIKSLFDSLLEEITKQDSNKKLAIPGSGDKKEDPSGDFIIFHEMLKYMKIHNTSCIFLTNDTTKGDWLQHDKNAHTHYLEHSYLLTEQVVFIVHAGKTLSISFENIHADGTEFGLTDDDWDRIINLREGTVLSVNNGFGFIFSKEGNIFFGMDDVINNAFHELKVNDSVRYVVRPNEKGGLTAKFVEKVEYAFDQPTDVIHTDVIASVNHDRGFGFINWSPENLFFHATAFDNGDEFVKLKIGDRVEFIIGLNNEGKAVAKKVRMTK